MAGLTRPGRRRALVGRPEIGVAVGVLRSSDGRVLVAERRPGVDGAGYWELPGGKIDAGETPAQAAARELREELGVRVDELEPWRTYTHDFSTGRVRLHFFRVRSWNGEPTGREGQRLAWVDPQHPAVGPLLPSNEPAMTALGLPELIAVARVDRGPGRPGNLVDRVRVLATQGVRLLIVRAPDLTPPQRVQLGRRLMGVSRGTGLRLVLSGTPLEALQAGVDGVHSCGTTLSAATQRPRTTLWVVSAHDSRDLARAGALGADAALVSPVLPTPAQPAREPLGWDGLRRLVAGSPLQVFARGGLAPDDLASATAAGAAGVAVDIGRLSIPAAART
ncbi:MAG: Nudix family hydrolase [Pseudonocardia sp.]|uniref:Nudix family hydrolase n=1 Tax=unclassified Pseudonocardia TaxID=2619320 RepID=UPI001AD29164|nr:MULTISPECIES: Nudix family hydrolase [unclassified Pseudonocardia]MBN9108615.1 Nudix family hydrolase [Pseudonocardia sp.]